jgi:hypothetical protein
MDYGKLCSELLEMNEKVRYVGVYNSFSGDVYEKIQGGVEINDSGYNALENKKTLCK